MIGGRDYLAHRLAYLYMMGDHQQNRDRRRQRRVSCVHCNPCFSIGGIAPDMSHFKVIRITALATPLTLDAIFPGFTRTPLWATVSDVRTGKSSCARHAPSWRISPRP
jgi:hypothetical protein